MDPRINMIMVGASDIGRLRAFYEDGLGWVPWTLSTSMSVAYKVGLSILFFLDADYLAKDSGMPASRSGKSIWIYFVAQKHEVDAVFARAIKAGGTVTSSVRDRGEGGYSGYFKDPEGNGWEVAWSPHMGLNADGALTLTVDP